MCGGLCPWVAHSHPHPHPHFTHPHAHVHTERGEGSQTAQKTEGVCVHTHGVATHAHSPTLSRTHTRSISHSTPTRSFTRMPAHAQVPRSPHGHLSQHAVRHPYSNGCVCLSWPILFFSLRTHNTRTHTYTHITHTQRLLSSHLLTCIVLIGSLEVLIGSLELLSSHLLTCTRVTAFLHRDFTNARRMENPRYNAFNRFNRFKV